jgi:hypothetical protein
MLHIRHFAGFALRLIAYVVALAGCKGVEMEDGASFSDTGC